MTDPHVHEGSPPEADPSRGVTKSGAEAATPLPSAMAVPLAPAAAATAPNLLSPEEQMALFEKDLQDNDWGHQPC